MSDEPELPLEPGKALRSVWESMTVPQRQALLPHLVGGTSADWLARELSMAGLRIGATSIKSYRRALRQAGVIA